MLQQQNLFDFDQLADRIALLAIYLPMIQDEIYGFVRLWNAHTIRPQKQRPNVVSGKPFMLYHHPGDGIQNWAVPFSQEEFRTIKNKVKDWPINAYLPPETLQWCQTFLDSIQFSYSRNIGDRTKPFESYYLQLRSAIQAHVRSNQEPSLSLLAAPTGAYNWELSVTQNLATVRDDIEILNEPECSEHVNSDSE
jgi:hypothetical protein